VNIKLQGPSLAWALGGALKIFTFIPNFVLFFIMRALKIAYVSFPTKHGSTLAFAC
jgi:hypothetical protein